MDQVNSSLVVERLPRDWYERFGENLVRYASDAEREEWPRRFLTYFLMARHVWLYSMDGTLRDLALPEKVDTYYADHFLGKTTTFYTIFGGDWNKSWRINIETFPVGPPDWMGDIWEMWTRQCREHERYDARFVIAPVRLSRQDDARFDQWLGLGKEPDSVSESDMQQLISWHLRNCDLLQARANATVTDEDHKHMKSLAYDKRLSQKSQPLLAPFTPTRRAVFMLGRDHMTQQRSVLLVLTGQDQDLKSGPATFDIIPRDKIISWRTDCMIEVLLETAICYLRKLERREEAVNGEFRGLNDARRRAIHHGLVDDNMEDVLELHSKILAAPDLDFKLGDWKRWAEAYVISGWEHLVADYQWFEVLSGTSQLRELWHLGEYQGEVQSFAEISRS